MAEPESFLFTYAAPFVGVLMIAAGIAGAVPGGYAVAQQELDLCGNPVVGVKTSAETERLVDGGAQGPTLDTVAFEDLSAAERRAIEEALDSPVREGSVRGAFPNRAAFENGTLVAVEGERYYASVVNDNTCMEVPPLFLPLGIVAILLGIGGVLTPPAYRRLARLEEQVTR